jgi:hypothetical protein
MMLVFSSQNFEGLHIGTINDSKELERIKMGGLQR